MKASVRLYGLVKAEDYHKSTIHHIAELINCDPELMCLTLRVLFEGWIVLRVGKNAL